MTGTLDIDATLAKLSISQKIKLLSGNGWWHTHAIPEAGVPPVRMSDGPNGARGSLFFNGVPSSCFPASTGLGSSFDVDLARDVAVALAEECRAKSTHVLLGPTVNTQRSPLGGRSFESFSEDPHLNGKIAAAYIRGLQKNGVAATIKHYVANDQEFQRFSISSEVSERALREVYLKPFQIAIREAEPWALMTAYNRVNGLHASENNWLLDDILRKEWGFKGLIMSDWTGTYSTAESIKAGLDLEMPGPSVMRGPAVERALVAEKLFPGDIDARVRKVLELAKRAQESGIPFSGPEKGVDTPALRSLLRRAAADATVLLKNDKGLLPLKKENLKKLAVIGPNAKQAFISGGGSARLLASWSVSPLAGIKGSLGDSVEVAYSVGATSHKFLPLLDGYIEHDGREGALLEFWNEKPDAFLKDGAKPTSPATWSTPTRSSLCMLIDNIDDSVKYDCYYQYSTVFTPDESGDWELQLTLAGEGILFVDGELVLDTSDAVPTDTFFGAHTVTASGVVRGLQAGVGVHLSARASTAKFVEQNLVFPYRGGVRIGAVRVVQEDDAIAEAVRLATDADAAILVIGLNHEWESEGFDRADLSLPGATNKLASAILRANPNTVVVNQSGAPVELPWADEAHSLIQAFYGGNELGNGLADVLFGDVNPSGKLALTFPKRLEDTPSFPSFGDRGEAQGKILYNEGIFVGYRSYDRRNLAPLFPFGHGLSYTTFGYADLATTAIEPEGRFTVSFNVTNKGNVDGREVAQVYIYDIQSSLPRAVRELKGFVKLTIKAGEAAHAEVQLDREALGFFDERRHAWVAEKGIFEVLVGTSSRDIKLRGEVVLQETFSWAGL